MKKNLLKLLICPACLPGEHPLRSDTTKETGDDILEGNLHCPHCATQFPIRDGIAFLNPAESDTQPENKYEQDEVVSSYMWSHFGDLLGDELASDAYSQWSELMAPHSGVAIDLGGAVGRFAFEMSAKCDLAVGIDNSVAFIKTARELMQNRQMKIQLKDEGFLTKEATVKLPEEWRSDRVEFIVADAQKIPFRSATVSSLASLNLVDKLPVPIKHLTEMNRITKARQSQFLLSDPFSWSEEAADTTHWLGGKEDGLFPGKGLDNIIRWLTDGKNDSDPSWQLENSGSVWWKIRTHTNHYELIRSCYLKVSR